jgi:hypothetical protein
MTTRRTLPCPRGSTVAPSGRSPGSRVQGATRASNAAPTFPGNVPSGESKQLPIYSGGTAPDLDRLPFYALPGTRSVDLDTNCERPVYAPPKVCVKLFRGHPPRRRSSAASTILGGRSELEFVLRFREARRAIENVVELPDRAANLFIKLCLSNGGKLSATKRKTYFPKLTEREMRAMERAVNAHMGRLVRAGP